MIIITWAWARLIKALPGHAPQFEAASRAVLWSRTTTQADLAGARAYVAIEGGKVHTYPDGELTSELSDARLKHEAEVLEQSVYALRGVN